jgi:glycosyltransferase involved in cell wall biosynthesis
LSRGIARRLRRLQRWKQVSAIVHNRRDLYDVKYLYGIRNVFDHPLAFLGNTQAEAIRSHASRHALPMLDWLPADAILVGVFGFLNEYKGFGTAIEALHYLPSNHHLLIFGGIHPNEITARQPLHPYISSLYRDAFIGTTIYDRISMPREAGAPALVLGPDRSLSELLGAHPRDLSGRIHFMGALDDSEFLTGMAVCDAVVFPYLEVGQSASGPISQALELGCRVIASRTRTFLEFAKYHRDMIEFFDIGNHLELAERVLARPQFAEPRKFPEFNAETNKAIYLLANSRLPRAFARNPTFPGAEPSSATVAAAPNHKQK